MIVILDLCEDLVIGNLKAKNPFSEITDLLQKPYRETEFTK